MDELHRLASSAGANEFGRDDDDEDDLEGLEMVGEFQRVTEVVAKEGLREGLTHGKELDMQKVQTMLELQDV